MCARADAVRFHLPVSSRIPRLCLHVASCARLRAFSGEGGKHASKVVRSICLPRCCPLHLTAVYTDCKTHEVEKEHSKYQHPQTEHPQTFQTLSALHFDLVQEFLQLVLPDLEQAAPRARDPNKERQVREAAERAIKEIRAYGFEVGVAIQSDQLVVARSTARASLAFVVFVVVGWLQLSHIVLLVGC